MSRPTAAERDAFAQGAKAQRGGVRISFGHDIFTTKPEQIAFHAGWTEQYASSVLRKEGRKLTGDDFTLPSDAKQVNSNPVKINDTEGKEQEMTTRTEEELTKLREDFASNYAGDNLDADFNQHLENLDRVNDVPGKPAKAKPKGKGKAKAAPKKPAAKKPAAPKAPKAKAFRPTSDDRKLFNAAAAKVAGKDVKTPRLVPTAKGATYTDFLQGKVLKLDADGSGETTLNVVSAKDPKTVVGTVTVTVTKGKVKATGAKA